MPPKRPRGSTARRASNGSNDADSEKIVEDAKPHINQLDSEASLPSDPLPPFETTASTTNDTTSVPFQPVSDVSTDVTPTSVVDSTPTVTPSHFTENVSAVTTPSQPKVDQTSNGSLESQDDQPVPATLSARGKKLQSQPKRAGRRNQARLQELQQAAIDNRPTPANASSVRRDARGRGGSSAGRGRGRGRGGYVDGGRRKESRPVASGPFGAGEASERDKRQAAQSSSRSRPSASNVSSGKSSSAPRTADDGKVIKQESGSSQRRNGEGERSIYLMEDDIDLSSDEDEHGNAIRRVNVENLGVVDLTAEDNDYDAFAPVRVTRQAHREEVFGINADGATNEDGAIVVDTNDPTAAPADKKTKVKIEAVDEDRIFQATYSDSDDDAGVGRRNVRKAPPPADANDALKDPPSSPELSKKGKGKVRARALTAEEDDFHTRDELDEWKRQQQDLEMLRTTLGVPAITSTPQDSDAQISDAQADKRKDNVYLFQFPPVMPELSSLKIKSETEDMEITDGNPTSAADPMIITEDPIAAPDEQRQTFPSGFVGKLRVHASGRVSLDWGGADMCLAMGTNATFLQDVVIANLPESKQDDDMDTNEQEKGTAMSMGQVKGKFVITPDFFA